ncbi:MAG: hypothetical protein Q8Q31_00075 [Nanoarchaeota archaeon]|nr:hypothetical protein [Nanoarchaeota archaeon]
MSENNHILQLEADTRFGEFLSKHGEYAAARLAEMIYQEKNTPPEGALREIHICNWRGVYTQPVYIIGLGKGVYQLKETEGLFFVPKWRKGKNKSTLDVKFIPLEDISL